MTRCSSAAGFAASLPPSDGRPQLCRKLCTSEISRPIQSIPVEVGSKGNPASMLHHHRQLALAIFVPIEANTLLLGNICVRRWHVSREQLSAPLCVPKDRKSTRLHSSHYCASRLPSSA